jgi:hypothetical protein
MVDISLSVSKKDRPRICAVDLGENIVNILTEKGLNCSLATLGTEVKVPNLNSRSFHECLLNCEFPPNLHEYDIVFVDLQDRSPIDYVQSEHRHSSMKGHNQTVLVSSFPETVFDPRPLASSMLRNELNSFFAKDAKTVLVLFCSKEEIVEYYPVSISHHGVNRENSIEHSLYDFIPSLSLYQIN